MNESTPETTPGAGLQVPPPPRATDDAIRTLARHIMTRSLYHGGMVEPRDALMVFLPLSLIDISSYDRAEWQNWLPVGIVGVHTTAGMQYNGFPVFMEMQWVHIKDLQAAINLAGYLDATLRTAPVPASGDPRA